MKHRWIACCAALVGWLTPLVAWAQDREIYDARLGGYADSMELDGGGVGLVWLLLLVMGAACLGVLFKSSGRTHLD